MKALSVLDKNIEVLSRACARYQPFDPDSLVKQMTASYQNLPRDVFFDPLVDAVTFTLDAGDDKRIGLHASWGNVPYKRSSRYEEGLVMRTSRGEYMRSKAEVIIAEKLYEFDIPFRYEQELCVGEYTFYPDFTFEGANGDEFYLEFFGMMDDPAYVRGYQFKRMQYENAGIVPWKNIIYHYACGNDIDVMRIDSIIRTQIIPWL